MTRLLVDVGNTRVKWALERDGVLDSRGASTHRGRPVAEALHPLQVLASKVERVIVSSVGGELIEEALRDLVQQRFGVAPEVAAVRREAFGLRIAYAHPERLGVDRWLGMLGARAMHAGVLLVVNAGTALTVDAVDAGGAHLGGLIVPGIATMKAALLAETAGIRDAGDDSRSNPALFADDTGAAVDAGTVHALAALVDRATAELARRAGALPTLVLTGGDTERIRPLLAARATIEPDLVLQGLVVYARGR
jgi:type III pantothenate kinase